jgi:hypothetical protein
LDCPAAVESDVNSVIASEAKQSRATKKELDCFVARAPRNDVLLAVYFAAATFALP